VVERFFAITAKRHFELVALKELLQQSQAVVRPALDRAPGVNS
jgi:hypothetical protein